MAASSAQIAQRQEDAKAKSFQRAARRQYDRAIMFRRLQVWPSLALAGAGPLVVLFFPFARSYLGAIGGAWLFVSRIALGPIVRTQLVRGALALESFDCYVLGLKWNMVHGQPLPDEEVYESARQGQDAGTWYPSSDGAPPAKSVLICQRSNVIWSRRQHRAYARLVSVMAIIWAIIGLSVAIIQSLTIEGYLVGIMLPSAASFLEAIEIRNSNLDTASRRRDLELTLDAAIVRSGSARISDNALRVIQDQIFEFRATSPLIPQVVYRVLRKRYNESMHAAAKVQAS
jgi:predicted pore-forming effector associated with SMODS systems